MLEVMKYYLCVCDSCLEADGQRLIMIYQLTARLKSTAETHGLFYSYYPVKAWCMTSLPRAIN